MIISNIYYILIVRTIDDDFRCAGIVILLIQSIQLLEPIDVYWVENYLLKIRREFDG